MTFPEAGLRVLFPPREKHKFIALVLKPPRDVGRAFDAWSFRELRRTAIQNKIVKSISLHTIHSWLKQSEIKPWRFKHWLNSTDPDFQTKMFGILRLYLEPPPQATIICIDEKTGMQALQRIFPDSPMTPGHIARREFGYIRHGTRTLFAAFNPHTGKVFGQIRSRHRALEFLAFLKKVIKKYPNPEKEIHLILDNFKTHKTEEIRKYVAALCGLDWDTLSPEEQKHILEKPNKRIVFHFLPFHASWLNQVEIWFSFLSRDVLRRGSFVSIPDLVQKVLHYIRDYNRYRAHPFKWTYTGQPLTAGIPAMGIQV